MKINLPPNVLTAVFTGVIALLFVTFVALQISNRVELQHLRKDIAPQVTMHNAQMAANALANAPNNVHTRLCTVTGEQTAACRMTYPSKAEGKGDFNNLWYTFSAVHDLSKSPLDDTSRTRLTSALVNFAKALNTYNVNEKPIDFDGLANSLYAATVKHAFICQYDKTVECIGGLTKPVAENLLRLTEVVHSLEPTYYSRGTVPAVEAILKDLSI